MVNVRYPVGPQSVVPRRDRKPIALALLLGLMAAGCVSEAKLTRVVVEVHSDFGQELASIRVQVSDEQGTKQSDTETFSTPSSKDREDGFLLSFAIAPGPSGESAAFLVTVTGADKRGNDVVRRTERGSFAAHSIRRLFVHLNRECGLERCNVPGPICSTGEPSTTDASCPAFDDADDAEGPEGDDTQGRKDAAVPDDELDREPREGGDQPPSEADGLPDEPATTAPGHTSLDAGVVRDASSADARQNGGYAAEGEACTIRGVACDREDPTWMLRCTGSEWVRYVQCSMSTTYRCDPNKTGNFLCASIESLCTGKKPGDKVCVENVVEACSEDLLTTSLVEACTGSTPQCVDGECVCVHPCGASCPDFASDSAHCGRCDHNCQGTACENGFCQPTQLAIADQFGRSIAVDSTAVYWTNREPGTLKSVGLSGGAVTTFVTGSYLADVQTDGDYVYYSGFTLGRVARIGGSATTLIGSDVPGEIALRGGYLYFFHSNGLQKMPTSGGTPTTLAPDLNNSHLVVDQAAVYYTDSSEGMVWKVDLNGGTPVLLASGQSHPASIAVDAEHVYWSNQEEPNAIMKVSLNGGPPSIFAAGVSSTPLVADESNVYWLDGGGYGSIMKQSAAGGAAIELAVGQPGPVALAVDDRYVYWLNTGTIELGTGSVMKVAK